MRFITLLIGAVLILSSVGGCGTASQKYQKGIHSYAAAGALVIIAIDNDFVSLETAEVIGTIDNAAHAELVHMRAALDSGNDEVALSHYARFRRVIASLQQIAADPGVPPPAELEPSP